MRHLSGWTCQHLSECSIRLYEIPSPAAHRDRLHPNAHTRPGAQGLEIYLARRGTKAMVVLKIPLRHHTLHPERSLRLVLQNPCFLCFLPSIAHTQEPAMARVPNLAALALCLFLMALKPDSASGSPGREYTSLISCLTTNYRSLANLVLQYGKISLLPLPPQ